jgi:hypothetical protein
VKKNLDIFIILFYEGPKLIATVRRDLLRKFEVLEQGGNNGSVAEYMYRTNALEPT